MTMGNTHSHALSPCPTERKLWLNLPVGIQQHFILRMKGNHTDYPNASPTSTSKKGTVLARNSSDNNSKAWSAIRKTAPKQDITRPSQSNNIERISPSQPSYRKKVHTIIPLSENSRATNVQAHPDQRVRRYNHESTLINETEFIRDTALLNYYSNHVFSQNFKFKRFTGILKKKFRPYPHTPEGRQTNKKEKEHTVPILNNSANFESPEWRHSKRKQAQCFDTLQPRLQLKRRPSSGIPMKKGQMVIKRRRNSINECSRSCSIGITHIDALKCSQRTRSPRMKSKDPKSPKKPVVPQCIFLRPIPPRLRQGQERIDPWQAQAEKVRLLTDMDISIKL